MRPVSWPFLNHERETDVNKLVEYFRTSLTSFQVPFMEFIAWFAFEDDAGK